MSDIKTLIVDGLWTKNPALIQLLGICPLLAITTTLVNGLALGIATKRSNINFRYDHIVTRDDYRSSN